MHYAGLPLPRFLSTSVIMTPKYIPVTLRWYKYHTWNPNYVAQTSRLIYQTPSHSQAIAEISGPMIHDKTPLLESIEQSCSGRTGLQYAKLSWTTYCLIISTTSTISEQNLRGPDMHFALTISRVNFVALFVIEESCNFLQCSSVILIILVRHARYLRKPLPVSNP
jgi:hypothetical protein